MWLERASKPLMASHVDAEILGELAGGEGPEWTGHLLSCAACQGDLAALRELRRTLGTPAAPPSDAVRSAAIAAALGEWPTGARRVTSMRRRGATGRWLTAAGSVAAAILVALAIHPLPDGQRQPEAQVSDLAGPAPAAPALGIGESASRARPELGNSAALASSDVGGNGGIASAARPSGAQPCEDRARAADPALGQVTLVAYGRSGSTEVVVLGFATAQGGTRVLALAPEDGCRVVARSAP